MMAEKLAIVTSLRIWYVYLYVHRYICCFNFLWQYGCIESQNISVCAFEDTVSANVNVSNLFDTLSFHFVTARLRSAIRSKLIVTLIV